MNTVRGLNPGQAWSNMIFGHSNIFDTNMRSIRFEYIRYKYEIYSIQIYSNGSNMVDLFESNICKSGFYSIYSIYSNRSMRIYSNIFDRNMVIWAVCEYIRSIRIYIRKNRMIYAIICKYSHKKCINLHIFA